MTHYDKMLALAMAGGGKIETLTGVPPLSFKSNGTPLISLSMLGNTQQTGTPSPDNIIMPEFVGARTGNLAPPNTELYSGYITTSGDFASATEYAQLRSDYTLLSGAQSLTLSHESGAFPSGIMTSWRVIAFYDADKVFIERQGGTGAGALTVSVPQNAVYYAFSFRTFGKAGNTMLNAGSTALPFEPFGWKIPISCAGQTVPVYLGQTQTVRKVKKLVLTGEENYTLQSINSYGIANFYFYLGTNKQTVICTHFKKQTTIISQTTDEGYLIAPSGQSSQNITFYMRIDSATASTAAELKSYLAAQYAAGTPVTVWYVLATPETGIVNEPLCKIGDYADELKITDEVTIPTIKGQNTLTVDTDLQPSEMTITYTR